MTLAAPHAPAAVLDALYALLGDVVRSRWSMSMDTLTQAQTTLHLAASLIQETMNAHCPINRLPPELLALVFSMVPSSLSLPGYSGPSSAKQTYELLPATHVCRIWRALALDMPSLWSTICETAPGHTAAPIFRARAQQAPLVVYVDRGRPSVALTHVFGHAAKISEVHLHDLRELSVSELASDIFGFPAHQLERVVVRRRVARTSGVNDMGTSHVKPVFELFSGIAPKLRSLDLHDVPFLPSNWFDSLTHLRLSFEASPVHWTLPDLFELLSQTPRLEDVRLSGLPTHLYSPDPPAVSSISLPTLRRLDISHCRGQENSMNLMRAILSPLVLAPFCAVQLLNIDASRLSPPDVRFPVTECSTTFEVDVTFTALALTASSPQLGSSLRIELNTAGATRTLLQQSIEAFIHGHATAIRTVRIASQRTWASWCDPYLLLGLLPAMTVLEFDDALMVDQCLDALRPSHVGETASHSAPAICPNLEMLHLPAGLTDLLVEKMNAVLGERTMLGPRLQCTIAGLAI